MSVITLTTDWKTNDYYVGAIKGKILNQCAGVQVVDISHQVPAFNITQAAFILRNCFYNFPQGSIHIIGVNTEGDPDQPFLLVVYRKHFFIGTDNGIFGLICTEEPEKIVRLKPKSDLKSFTGFTLFAETACKLVRGEKPESLGSATREYHQKIPIRAAIDHSVITGSVIYIDSYRNAITNITRELFQRVGKERQFEIFVQSNHYVIDRINQLYNETPPGEILAIFNSVGLLEIAINKGNAADLLNLSTHSSIRVKFGQESGVSRKKQGEARQR